MLLFKSKLFYNIRFGDILFFALYTSYVSLWCPVYFIQCVWIVGRKPDYLRKHTQTLGDFQIPSWTLRDISILRLYPGTFCIYFSS